MRKIYLEGGYLVLETLEAEDLFESLIEQGTFWEYVTVLFNERAVNRSGTEHLQEDMKNMKLTMESMMKQMVQFSKIITALPPKSDEQPTPSEYDSPVIKEVTYEKVEAKPKAGSLSGALGNFARMGRKK